MLAICKLIEVQMQINGTPYNVNLRFQEGETIDEHDRLNKTRC